MKLSVTEGLSAWYDADIRELPWKNTRDPYKIWLSEIILQQTRVQQGTPYYLKFIDRFSNIEELASADLDDILKLWEGLGYYSRARNLYTAAKQVVEEFNGIFPISYKELLKLKGIGEYTAAAIASFAYDEPVAVVDGNVFRFLSRLYGISDPINSTAGKKKFQQLASDVLDRTDPASHNQAIMDFGALVCLPKNPSCTSCPFSIDCVARNEDKISMLPFKSNKIKKRKRVLNFYVIHDGEYFVVEQRNENDIWKGLYQFPLYESTVTDSSQDVIKKPDNEFLVKVIASAQSVITHKWYKQVLSHQNIQASFTVLTLKELAFTNRPSNWKIIPLGELMSYAFPRIIHKFLQEDHELLPSSYVL